VSAHTNLDRAIVGLTLIVVIWTFAGSQFSESRAVYERVAIGFSVAYCSLLITRMLSGGAQSPLWNWLPPLWPWGRIIQSNTGRWIFVIVMLAGTVAGIVQILFPRVTT
jgi:glycerol uptake facilitator-like aquaporin